MNKTLPKRPKLVDGKTRFMSIPEVQSKMQKKRKEKAKVKFRRFSFLAITLCVVGSFFFSTRLIKAEKKINHVVKISIPKSDIWQPLSEVAGSQELPRIEHEETTDRSIAAVVDESIEPSYVPYEGTNSESSYDPYLEEVERNLVYGEESPP